jgi:hypothetical protein
MRREMASLQRDGVRLRCGRCRRPLCRALLATSGGDVVVKLVDVLSTARLTVATDGPGPAGRVRLACRRQVVVYGLKNPCGWTQPFRLDAGPLVGAVTRLGGRGELVLGVDL